MSRSVTFNGITQFRPGGLSKINANSLARIGLATNGIVGLVGEANGGTAEPGTLVILDDPALASEFFESGPLADAVRIAFDPSDDVRLSAGAFRVKAIVTNKNTQSTLELKAKVPPVLGAATGTDTVAALSTQTVINLTGGGLTPNAEVGNHLRIGNEEREIILNTASAVTVSPGFTTAPVTGLATTILAMQAYVNNYAGGILTLDKDTSGNPIALTVDAHIGNYVRIGNETVEITDNDATTVTATFVGTPVAGQIVEFLAPTNTYTSKIYGTRANRIKQEFESGSTLGVAWSTSLDGESQVSEDIGNQAWLILEYVGQSLQVSQTSGTSTAGGASTIDDGAATWGVNAFQNLFVEASGPNIGVTPNLRKIASNTGTQITVSSAWANPAGAGDTFSVFSGKVHGGTLQATATANSCTLEAALNVAANELAGLVIAITSGTGVGQRRVIQSNTAGVGATVVVEKNWVTEPDATSVYEIRYVTAANATISGSQGNSTSLTTRVAANGAAEAADLNITFTQDQTLQDLVNEINQNADYVASLPGNISPLSFVNNFDYDNGSYRVEIRNDSGAETSPVFPQPSPPIPWLNRFRKDLYMVVEDINSKNEWSSVARDVGASQGAGGGLPEYTGGVVGTTEDAFLYMSGGTRGASSNTEWQNALDELLKTRVNHLAVLISEDLSNQTYGSTATFASVAAQTESHVGLARGIEKNERGAYMGIKGTKQEYIDQCVLFNDPDVQLTSQRLTVLDVTGNLKEMDEWSSAVAAAGMRAGMPEVGEPMTHKYVRTNAIAQDSSWDPNDRTDANQLIQAGALFIEYVEGKGYRWVRDLTTWSRDDNLVYSEGSVRDSARFYSYGLRTFLEDRFTGVKARPATASSIRDSVAEYSELARGQSIIVDSVSESGAIVRAYHNIRVNISGDIARVRVEVFLAPGINFQLTDIYLQIPTQLAT